MNDSDILDSAEGAAYLGLTPTAFRQAIYKKRLPASRITIGRQVRIVVARRDLDVYRATRLGKIGRPRGRKGEGRGA